MAATVFLSYASKDQKTAETICQALEGRGLECWMAARNVHPGENFQEAIVRAIRGAKVMLFVFSANSNNSDEVKKEIVLAGQHKVFVIPIRVEDVVPNDSLSYEFATRQWIDLFRDWDFALEQLTAQIVAVTALVSGGNTTAPPTEAERVANREAAAGGDPTIAVTTDAGAANAAAAAAAVATGIPDIEAMYAQGNTHAKAKEYDQAIEQYDRVIRVDPQHINALNNRGNAYLAKAGYDQAIADFDKAIAIKPDFATAYANRGNAYQDRGEFDRAIRDYGVALQLKPDLAVALDNRAKAYDRKGMHDQARKDRTAAAAMRNPRVPTPLTAPTATSTPAAGAQAPAVAKPVGAAGATAGPAGALQGILTGGNRVFVIAGGALVGLILLALVSGAIFKPKVVVESSTPALSDAVDSSAPSAAAPTGGMSAADAVKNGNTAWNAKNYDDALTFYRQAATLGNADGQNGIGTLYYYGRGGLPLDYGQAMKWFQLAAAQGNEEAENSIGNLYDSGYGVPVDYVQAMKWYLLAANQGNAGGEAGVGSLYANGNGVPVDLDQARVWFTRAAAGGDQRAKDWLAQNP
ncbi:MAG TPA: TIR domain-containing protein [Caulobacteraceae bacterium]